MLTKMDRVVLTLLVICLFPVWILAAISQILSVIRDAWVNKVNSLLDKAGW